MALMCNERMLVYQGDKFELGLPNNHVLKVVVVDGHAVVTLRIKGPDAETLFERKPHDH